LVAAIATLTDLEQRVLFMTARGDDCKEIAEDLGVSHQQTREALMRARRLCRMLIEHADGQKVSENEAQLLWQYRDGELSGKRARELKRHVQHCTACQRLLGLEEAVEKAGMHAILPIPLLLLAAGKPAAVAAGILPGSSATAATTGGAASVMGAGGSGGVQLGQTILASQIPTAFTVSVTAGITAKVGLALGTLAAAGSMGGIYKLAHDKQAQREASRTPPAKVVSAPAPAQTITGMKRAETPPPAPTSHKKKAAAKKPAANKHEPKAATAAGAQNTQPSGTATQNGATPPATNSSKPKSTGSQSSGPSGGEFVFGTR